MLEGMRFLPCWLFVSFGVWRNFYGCFRGWSESNCKGRTRKKIAAESIHFVVLTAVRERERENEWVCVLSLEVKMESVSCLSVRGVYCLCELKWKKMSSWKTIVYVSNPCHAVGSKIAGQNQVADVVVSTNHVTFLTNRFTSLISLPMSALFVSRTSGITAILKYRSVNTLIYIYIYIYIYIWTMLFIFWLFSDSFDLWLSGEKVLV